MYKLILSILTNHNYLEPEAIHNFAKQEQWKHPKGTKCPRQEKLHPWPERFSCTWRLTKQYCQQVL